MSRMGSEKSHDEQIAARKLRVGLRVVVKSGHSKGEHGVITNTPQKVFTGWTVKLDNGGRVFGAGGWELRPE